MAEVGRGGRVESRLVPAWPIAGFAALVLQLGAFAVIPLVMAAPIPSAPAYALRFAEALGGFAAAMALGICAMAALARRLFRRGGLPLPEGALPLSGRWAGYLLVAVTLGAQLLLVAGLAAAGLSWHRAPRTTIPLVAAICGTYLPWGFLLLPAVYADATAGGGREGNANGRQRRPPRVDGGGEARG